MTGAKKTIGRRPPADEAPKPAKTIGRAKAKATGGEVRAKLSGETAPPNRQLAAAKTLGRASRAPTAEEATSASEASAPTIDAAALTVALRGKLADRLAGRLSAVELTAWAKTEWLQVQTGEGAVLDPQVAAALEAVIASGLTGGSDEMLIELMARL